MAHLKVLCHRADIRISCKY